MIYKPELSNINTEDIGEGCKIHSHVWIGEKVKIGRRCKIQSFVYIPDGVTLEDDVFVGPGVIFTNDPDLSCKGKDFWKTIVVKQGAKIGAGAIIKAGVIIGENAIVGMGAVVLKDVLANTTVAGNPAKKI